MAAVDIQSQGEPAAQTVSAVLDAAAERIAAAGVENARADAEALVAEAMGVKPEELSVESAGEVPADVAARIERLVLRRIERQPMAYVLGHAPFRGLEIAVDERVLWPRRETELLVEVGVELPDGARVHEVGTGSGAIALALISERPDLRVSASDLSPEAVEAARENAERLGLDLDVSVATGLPDGLEGVDLVIANLPYVTDSTIFERSPEIQKEPRIAVTGDCGEDGLGVIRGLIAETPSGWKLAMEHDTHHGPAMRELLRDATTLQDYEGDERVTVGFAP
ncbi:MAG TPA: peptide chain release factor N(5)-glutamine methyltransferase [Solirubrobacterales bacterium]|jgi:release factor glutamine methyltransferase|nr:peptide chain release factor N(5)-glutamine methyltransferase [Solirubrobacterales bacterium]